MLPTGGKNPQKKKPGEKELEPPPDVEIGDEVYFRHPSSGQPACGMISARGQHGAHVDSDGRRYRVKWEEMLGHKVRLRPQYTVIDSGEDGMIVEEPAGRRRYINDPDAAGDGAAPVSKALAPIFILFGEGANDLYKAIKNRPGLSLQDVTDKAGKQTKRWKRTAKPEKKERKRAAPGDSEAGSKAGYGTHNLKRGSTVHFTAAGFTGSGKIVGTPGKLGARVRDKDGNEHKVGWHEITGHEKPPVKNGGGPKPAVLGKQDPIAADKFDAISYARSHDDSKVTEDSILSQFPAKVRKLIATTQERLKGLEETIEKFKDDKTYLPARKEIHRKIFDHFMSDAKRAAATPEPGKDPTLTILGGRGGSGKSKLEGRAYDPEKAIVLDADKVKELLPEYEGWNAAQVHEESGDVLDDMVAQARNLGLNLVIDATLKSPKSAMEKVKAFKDDGYRVEAHYMHLPRQEAAKRGVDRFLGERGRYVPIEVILGNTSNEHTFEMVKDHADAWSFWDNNVPRGADPVLISQSNSNATGKGEPGNEGGEGLNSDREGGKSKS